MFTLDLVTVLSESWEACTYLGQFVLLLQLQRFLALLDQEASMKSILYWPEARMEALASEFLGFTETDCCMNGAWGLSHQQ